MPRADGTPYPSQTRAAKRAYDLRIRYGLTVERYEALLAAQDGACGICGTREPGGRGNTWHVDHDHVTGAVRGLLCSECNIAIGKFHDDAKTVARAAAYLLGWTAAPQRPSGAQPTPRPAA